MNDQKNPSSSSSSSSGTHKIEMENQNQIQIPKKPKILCLHGFRTSAAILEKQVRRWPDAVLDQLDFVFADGPLPARGKSSVERFYDPPYYEWYNSNQDFTDYHYFEECVAFLEDFMIRRGPFDGLLGFSQGAILSGALPGMQRDGLALTKVPKIKFVILISGSKFGGYKIGMPKLAANAYSSPIKCPSLHIIGETDFLREQGIALLESFEDPVVIHHSMGHTVPRLDEKGLETMLRFIEKIQKMKMPPNVDFKTCLL